MRKVFYYVFITAFLQYSLSFADIITLKSGTSIYGRVQSLENDLLSIETKDVGSLRIHFSSVKNMQIDDIVYVQFKDSRCVSGLMHLRSQEVNIDIYLPPSKDKVGSVTTEKQNISKIAKIPISEYEYKWSNDILIGGSFYTGNSTRKALDVLYTSHLDIYHYEKLSSELDIQVEYDFLQADGDISNNDGMESITFAKYLSRRWSWYALEEVSFSKPDDLNLRTDVELGLGFRMIDLSKFRITIRSGFGRIDSFYSVAPKHEGYFAIIPGARLWGKHHYITFTNNTWSAVSLSQKNTYLLYSDSKMSFPITTCQAFVLRYEIDYNSKPATGKKKMDTRTTLNFMHSF